MSETKIVLSAKELKMVTDSAWILTKQKIIQQVYDLLESVIREIDTGILPQWKNLTLQPPMLPRIFKGENYLGLPYVTLDYPRSYEGENFLTLRTMFWWGKFVSVTLHASGIYKTSLIKKIQRLQTLEKDQLLICVHHHQWHHYFEPDNYVLLKNISAGQMREIEQERSFIKIAYKTDLSQFNELHNILSTQYKLLAAIIT